MIDYYATLEIKKTATLDEIKEAYRRLAKLHHPDLNNGSEESAKKFKAINEAFANLSDSLKRSKYDSQIPVRPAKPARPVSPEKQSKYDRMAERAARAKNNPLNYTVDVDVGEVDLWEQTFTRLKEEEIADEILKKETKKAREQAEERELKRKARVVWKPPPIYKPKPNYRQEGWYDCFAGQYLD